MTAAEPAAAGLPYDAYVSYADADREWVEQRLVPPLAGAGRRLFLDHDLPPGGVEVEERCRAVAASRKTLLVLSRELLDRGRWGLVEEAVTRELDPAALKRRLIPVLRERCEVPLRMRPLVTVDLSDGGDRREWRRLIEALDPARDDEAGLLQRWSLRLAEATSGLAEPSWHGAGAAWLAAAYLALIAATALCHLLFWDVAALRYVLTLLLMAPLHGVAALAWREDRDLFRRLSHLAGRSSAARAAAAAAVVLAAAGWWWLGVPAARAHACGSWGCREPGTLRLALEEFDVPDGLPDRDTWARAGERLVQKLGAAPGVEVLGQNLSQVDDEARRRMDVDYTLSGQVYPGPVVAVGLFDRHLHAAPPEVTVGPAGSVPDDTSGAGDFARIQELQNRLALALLRRLEVELTPEQVRAITGIPTADPVAAELNDEGFRLQREGRYAEAEERLRRAVERHDGFSVAWSNLAEVAWRTGRYEEALEYRRKAVERLPTYAPFHYNLGHLLALMGRHEEARAPLETALALDPVHVPTYNELGNVLLALGEPRAARETLDQGLLLDRASAPLSKNLGRALLAEGDAAAAAAALERALDFYPPADWLGRTEAHSLLVQAHVRRRREAEACRHLDDLRRLDPEGVAPWSPAAEAAAAGLPCTDREPRGGRRS